MRCRQAVAELIEIETARRDAAKQEMAFCFKLAPVSDGIVQKHQGRIEVESVVGQGSTFLVTLPIRQAAPDDDVQQTSA